MSDLHAALADLASIRRDYDRMETALRHIVEHGKQQPVPMDPIAFNMMAMARAALDGLEGDDLPAHEGNPGA